MNRIVSTIEVSGLSLRIKDADTGSDYGTIASVSWSADENNPEAVFDLGSPSTKGTIASKLVIGRYYKIQLAYIDNTAARYVGYYSTVCIVKFTTKPTVAIGNLNRYMTNSDITRYTGVYHNRTDVTEKAYHIAGNRWY